MSIAPKWFRFVTTMFVKINIWVSLYVDADVSSYITEAYDEVIVLIMCIYLITFTIWLYSTPLSGDHALPLNWANQRKSFVAGKRYLIWVYSKFTLHDTVRQWRQKTTIDSCK